MFFQVVFCYRRRPAERKAPMLEHVSLSFPASILISSLFLSPLLAGCHVNHKAAHDEDNVGISTPFGGMSVKTNEAAVEGSVGLSVYPGATLIRKDSNNGAADVNMSFGGFHLGVKALSYQSVDSPAQVIGFYRKDMARYGAVLLCQGDHPIGQPDHTQDGLTCDSSKGGHVHVDTDNAKQELKAGSKLHQHIVSIDPEGSGTKIALVALDLPGKGTSFLKSGGQ